MNSVLRLCTQLYTIVLIQKAQESARRTSRLVARTLDPREEGYEISSDYYDDYMLRDRFSRD